MTRSRRDFLKTTSLASGALVLGSSSTSAMGPKSPNDKINVAFIGIGGRGRANLDGVVSQGKEDVQVVALCDVDDERAGNAYSKYSQAKKFYDYREMYDQMADQIDAVVISTPDHTHFHPTHAALKLKKHVYLEKPMAHNVREVRILTDLAREQGVATQLGVQRHTIENMHRVVEIIQAGVIGDISEVYCWVGGERGMPNVPADKMPVPDSLKWDLWLGPARERDYHKSICPYGWRFWWDYGTGETGNWGCHILDIPYWALGLKYPTRVWAEGPEPDRKRTPKQMSSHFDFPEHEGRRAVTLHWSHDSEGPAILRQKGLSHKGNNTLFIGEKGMLLCGFSQRKLYPQDLNTQIPEPSIEKSPGFYREWINAIQGGPAATCHFDYSGPMAETVLLGNLAYRSGGEAFDWDSKNLITEGNERAQMLVSDRYRRGWSID